MKSPHPHSETGRMKAKLKREGHREARDSTIQMTLTNFLVPKSSVSPNPRSVTPESAQNIKEGTSKDRYKTLGKRTLSMRLSQKLPQESTGPGRSLTPFWTEHSEELSQKLWLPTETGCVDLDLNLLPKCSNILGSKSWYTVKMKSQKTQPENLSKTSCPSSLSLWQRTMESAQQKTEEEESVNKNPRKKRKATPKAKNLKQQTKAPAGKAMRYRLYPTNEQKQLLQKWFGVVRWTYNKCLDAIRDLKKKRSKKELRAYCLNKEAFGREDMKPFQWSLDVPYDIRDEAMNDVLKAYKSNLAKGGNFQIQFRSKKDKQQSISILNKHWGRKKGTFSFLRTMKSAEPLPEVLFYDSRLLKTRTGHYYLCVPKPLEARSEDQAPVFNEVQKSKGAGIVALDPGVRTFQTCFDPSGLIAEWGAGDKARLGRLCHAYDDLQGRWSQKEVRHSKRNRMKKAGLRIQFKIKNLVDDLHKKMVKWLCANYQLILLPSFGTKGMVRRLSRKITGKTARAMLTWAHYRFRQRLLFKSQEYPWCKVIICNEAYTSITCGHCGKLNRELGKKKIFECPSCCWILDRDVNGARNILLKYLTEQTSHSSW